MNFQHRIAILLLFNAFNAVICDINFLLGLYKEMNAIYLKFRNSYDIFKPEHLLQMMAPSQWDTASKKGNVKLLNLRLLYKPHPQQPRPFIKYFYKVL